jgi:hypothetical protein
MMLPCKLTVTNKSWLASIKRRYFFSLSFMGVGFTGLKGKRRLGYREGMRFLLPRAQGSPLYKD